MLETFPHTNQIRQAGIQDREAVRSLIDNHEYYHHHLDWQSPVDWLGQQPYLILGQDGKDMAALACPPTPPGIGWIRLFAALDHPGLQRIWDMLLSSALEVSGSVGLETICGLAVARWFQTLLENSHFHHHQDVVGLIIRLEDGTVLPAPNSVEIREAKMEDIPQIAALDAKAFDRMWQHSLSIMERAFEMADYVSVALVNGEVIGYQLSTSGASSAHLARLAVEPRLQNQRIGSALISDLFRHTLQNDIHEISVNTQSDNQASLSLYTRMGFTLTGEKYPVYTYRLP